MMNFSYKRREEKTTEKLISQRKEKTHLFIEISITWVSFLLFPLVRRKKVKAFLREEKKKKLFLKKRKEEKEEGNVMRGKRWE